MSTVLPQYPFDPTGQAATNKVTETQSIRSRGMFDHYFIIPRSGPFYADSVKLRLYPQGANVNNPAAGTPLEEGVDFNFGYHFAYASHTIGLPVYGAITFYDRQLEGQLRMEYQTIGDDWVLDDQQYSELLLNVAYNPRIGQWEQVVELPREFPVVNHAFNIDDFVGMSEVVDELGDIEQALLMKNAGGLADHLADQNNPHKVTKAQVGLGLVDNYPTATQGEAVAGVANNRFMTPARTKQLIDAVATTALNAHAADYTNPHQVTKAQVGLGNVQNYAVASQAEAEAGSSAARYMTPLRVREAIEAIVGTQFTAHLNDRTNPHAVTKAQVGLGNVPNIPVATNASALTGTTDDGIITPRLLSLVLSETVGSGVTDHIQNSNNPHGVTKSQVGLGSVQNYGIATEAEARDATSNIKYMTPLAVRQAINELVGDSSNAHVTDKNNPHGVTKAQVGLANVQNYPTASTAEARDGTATDRYMTPLATREAIDQFANAGINTHAADKTNPHGVTKAQVGLGSVNNYATASVVEARAGTATDRYMTPLATREAISQFANAGINAHADDVNNPHRVTAAQVGTYTEQEIDALLAGKLASDGTAGNANRVFGMNQADLQAWVSQQKSADTLKFDGKTYTQAKADILAGKAGDTAKFDGKTYAQVKADMANAVEGSSIQYTVPEMPLLQDAQGNEVAAPAHWIKLGTFRRPTDSIQADLTLMITGGRNDESEGAEDKHQSVVLEIGSVYDQEGGVGDFTMHARGAAVKHLTPANFPIVLGYVSVGANATAAIDVYLKGVGQRNVLTITELSYKLWEPADFPIWEDTADIVTTQPAGIVYPTVYTDGSKDISDLKAFIARKDNPHAVTKAQVGLSAVNNYGTATAAQALTGTATNLHVTPAGVTAKVDDSIGKMCDELITVIDASMPLFA